MNTQRSFAAALIAVALLSRPALADVSDVDRATARSLTLEGYEALDRKDYATAADRFGRADALYHAPTVSLGLAHAQVGLGKLVEALITYSRLAHETVPPGAPPAFTKALDDARQEMAALLPRIPSVIIIVHGAEGAKVTMDGVEVSAAALGVKRPADPGTHVIRATAPNALPSEVKITVLEGKVETVSIELKPDPSAVRVAPLPPPILPPVAAPPVSAPPAPVPEGTSTQRLLGFVSLGVGGAGLVLGAVTGGLAASKHGKLVDQCPEGRCFASQQATLQSDVDAYHTMGTLSTAGFVVGGVGVATGVILLLTAPKAKPTREATVTPLIGPGFVGAQGRF